MFVVQWSLALAVRSYIYIYLSISIYIYIYISQESKVLQRLPRLLDSIGQQSSAGSLFSIYIARAKSPTKVAEFVGQCRSVEFGGDSQ